MMAFQYYEVRPVIREDGTAQAYDDEASFFEAYHALASHTGSLPEAFDLWPVR